MAQLKMYWFPGTPIDDEPLPEGYSFSTYKGDEDKSAWVEICKNGLVADDADDSAFDDSILSWDDIDPYKDVFFLDYNGEHIGTVTAFKFNDRNVGDMHMVGIRTDFRGKKLNISVENPNHVQSGVKSVSVNGTVQESDYIKASDLTETNEIIITLG